MDKLVERLNAILPLMEGLEVGQDCEEYAFARGKGFQAMTYVPAAFQALVCVPDAIERIQALEAALAGVRARLDNIAELTKRQQLPLTAQIHEIAILHRGEVGGSPEIARLSETS